jgi:hypothetical protein
VSAAATATTTTVARRATGHLHDCMLKPQRQHTHTDVRPARTHLTLSARPVAMPTVRHEHHAGLE